jgi:hypothetical protein
MDADLIHNVDRGLTRLLGAPRDLDGGTPVPAESPAWTAADPALRAVFESYREGYGFLHDHCFRWWRGCIASAQEGGMSREEAVDEAYARRAAGPASAPEFVWFIRHFWLRVDRVNQGLALAQRAAPQDVLLKWLVEAGEPRYVVLATAMPYWPIGLDARGEWC